MFSLFVFICLFSTFGIDGTPDLKWSRRANFESLYGSNKTRPLFNDSVPFYILNASEYEVEPVLPLVYQPEWYSKPPPPAPPPVSPPPAPRPPSPENIVWKDHRIGMHGAVHIREEGSMNHDWHWPAPGKGTQAPCRQLHCLNKLPNQPDAKTLETHTVYWPECPPKCSEFGTCNRELGRCDCVPGRAGEDCQDLAAPHCTITQHPRHSAVLWKHGPPEYHVPCSAGAPKTCACQRDCRRMSLNFHDEHRSPTCKETDSEVIDTLRKCKDMCSFNGWCEVHAAGGPKCRCLVGWEGSSCQHSTPAYCVNGCSGKGTCRAGTCHCLSGFYGVDCSLYIGVPASWPASSMLRYTDAEQPVRSVAARMPHGGPEGRGGEGSPQSSTPKKPLRVYVYDLPPQLTTWLYHHAAWTWEGGPEGSTIHAALQGREGGHFKIGPPELFLHEKFLTSAHRTTDPTKADFFFIPFWQAATEGLEEHKLFLGKVLEYVKTTWPYFNLNKGQDHMLVMASPRGVCDTRFVSKRARRPIEVKNIIVLTHFGGVVDRKDVRDHRHRSGWQGPCFFSYQDIVIPPPLLMNTDQSALLHSGVGVPKIHTLFFAGRIFPHGKYHSDYGIKDYLRDVRVAAFKATEGLPGYRVSRGLPSANYTYFLSSSTFCLVPAGNGPGWGTRLVESLAYGCIPVIIQDNVHQPYDEYLDYSKFSIRVRAVDIDTLPSILGNLTKLHRPFIRKLQDTGKCVLSRFLWSSVYGRYGSGPHGETGKDDAFATLIQVLQSRITTRHSHQTPHSASHLSTLQAHLGSRLAKQLVSQVNRHHEANTSHHFKPIHHFLQNLCPDPDALSHDTDVNGEKTGDAMGYSLCRMYCKQPIPCNGGDRLSNVRMGNQWDKLQVCKRAPNQPKWLPWPSGGAQHL